MAKLMRACVILLIALVAAWSVAQAAGSATMRHDMAGFTSHHEHALASTHCHDCDMSSMGDDTGALCQIACLSPIIADLSTSSAPVTAAPVMLLDVFMSATDLHGRSDPPDPFPPRASLLT
jgi:hypothetical protein